MSNVYDVIVKYNQNETDNWY